MKSKITVLAVTLACLSQGAAKVHSQMPYGAGYAPNGYAMAAPAQYAAPHGAAMQTMPMQAVPQPVPAPLPSGSAPLIGQPAPSIAQGAVAPGYPTQTYPVQSYGVPSPIPQYSMESSPAMPAPSYGAPSYDAPSYGAPSYSEPGYYSPAPTACDTGVCDSAGGCSDCGLAGCSGGCGSGGLGNLFGGLLGDNGPARPARIWGGVEYLLWWNKNRTVPVLATTSTDGTPFGQAGVIGQPGTSVLFGGGKYDDDVASGIRGSLGLWLDQRQTVGVWGRAYQLGTED
ncbi:MAG: BBP7 family outer membrane beta-barrel protein, partial [Planctomycetales bacterium]|nr:BBP7 family outer membrane beta-barrel protein [Planctomycetales bacterium]